MDSKTTISAAEDELVELVAKYACQGYKKHALKKAVETELGVSISIVSFEHLRVKAKKLLKDSLLSPADHQANAIEMIYQVAQTCKYANVKLRAADLLLSVTQLVQPEENDEKVRKIQAILAGVDKSVDDNADASLD